MMAHSPIPDQNVLTELSMPSGKLTAVTRKRHDIEQLLQDQANKKEVVKCYGEFLQKVDTLLIACEDIKARSNSDEARKKSW